MNKIEWTMQVIRDQIHNKKLLEGARLPSVRQMAIQLNHSVSTVVEAYARLAGENLIESRVGAGFFVCTQQRLIALPEVQHEYHREIDPLWIARQSLDAQQHMLKPGCGWLPEDWMPVQSIRKALKLIARSDIEVLTNYATPQGHLGLRQHPTGAVLTSQIAYQIAKLAEQANIIIVEDDIFADLELTPAPKYAALAGLAQVFHIGSFSKTLSAAVRCGYIISQTAQIQTLIDLKISTQFSNAQLNEEIVYQALTDSLYPKHLEGIKNRLIDAMNQTIQRLSELNIEAGIIPRGGMFLWCELPNQMDAGELSKICLQHAVVLAPGNAFSQSKQAHHFLRFNVAQCNDKRVYDVLKSAMQ